MRVFCRAVEEGVWKLRGGELGGLSRGHCSEAITDHLWPGRRALRVQAQLLPDGATKRRG